MQRLFAGLYAALYSKVPTASVQRVHTVHGVHGVFTVCVWRGWYV